MAELLRQSLLDTCVTRTDLQICLLDINKWKPGILAENNSWHSSSGDQYSSRKFKLMAALTSNNVKYGDWQKERLLGSGGFGQVSLWVNVKTRERIAVKMCKLQLQEKQFNRWQQEVWTCFKFLSNIELPL